MQVLVVAHRARGAEPIRRAARPMHLKYMIDHRDRLVHGGSFQDDNGEWGGMLVVLEVLSIQAARDWLDREPFHVAGVFESVTVTAFRQMVPEPSPGLLADELAIELRNATDAGSSFLI